MLLCLYLAVTLAIAWRLVEVQVVDAAEFRGLAAAQTQRVLELPARRGKLYDRSGEPLAMSLTTAAVYGNPRLLTGADVDPAAIAATLAPLLERPVDEVAADLREDAGFVYLARQIPREVGDQITALRLPGIGVLHEPKRVYPAGSLAAQVVGFAGIDNTGLSGLELQYDDLLSGTPGRVRLERAPGGVAITAAPRQVSPPVPGTDVVLTIDRQIQYAAERVLAEAVEQHGADGGSAIVMAVDSGEILAMASIPTFDPARIGAADGYARRNRAVTDVYEPGSVNKAITAAAALEEGLVTPQQVWTVPDSITIAGQRFGDSHAHPPERLTFAEVIEQSSNVGTIMVAKRLGAERLHDYLRRFGYGSQTRLGFPGESGGLLHDPQDWSGTSLPTIAIGQGVSATLLQVAGVFETIASGGEWVEPRLVRGTVGPDGRLDNTDPPERRRVVSEQVAAQVTDMLVGVVESEHGTGENAAVAGYRVAGKTGTAQKPSTTRRGYEPGAYVASFVGFAPAEDPALVVAVMIDEPRPVYYGGLTAAPAFSEIMDFALSHRRVPPSDPAARAQADPVGH